MKVLTYTSYKEHCDLYTEIHGSIAVNRCQIELAQKIFYYQVSLKRTGVENTKFISFNLLAGTYSTNDFNAKIKVAIVQQRQDWEPPQIKDLRLVIPEHYKFMASNTIFAAFVYPTTILKRLHQSGQPCPPGSHKTFLDTSTPPKLLSLHCKEINKVKNDLDGQPSTLLACIHASSYRENFSPMHLVFLELDTDRTQVDFKMLDENNNKIIPRTLYLELSNKE